MNVEQTIASQPVNDSFVAQLTAIVGDDGVLRDDASLQLAALDLFFEGKPPLAEVHPNSAEMVAQVVNLCRAHGVAICPRGGGMSYTSAFQPQSGRSIAMAFDQLSAIREIAVEAGHVTVEAGCTWAALDEALAKCNRRARFWGPMSGGKATVGGSMSQGTVTFGSGVAGASANAVKSFEIVSGKGEIIKTGSDGTPGLEPNNRNFGPDLTGIFANDAGALGIKTAITLELEPRPGYVSGLSFAYDDYDAMSRLFGAVAERRLASEFLAMDGDVARQNAGNPNVMADVKAMWRVGRAAGNPVAALGRMGRIAAGGRRFLDKAAYTAHFMVEGRDKADLGSRIKAIRKLAGNAAEIVNTVPLMTRAYPFPALPVTHPDGRRMLPIHAIFTPPASRAFHRDYVELKEQFAPLMDEAQVSIAEFFAGIAGIGVLYEPVFYWPDAITAYHRSYTPEAMQELLVDNPDNPSARALVREFITAFNDLARAHAGTHFQIGRAYPYAQHRDETAGGLLRAIKDELDPDNIINPGALGLSYGAQL